MVSGTEARATACPASSNMRVLVPADAISVKKLLEKIVDIPGPFYVRLARPSTQEIYSEESDFEIGKGTVIKDGNDISLF